MPKLKSKSGAAKRFKALGSGDHTRVFEFLNRKR